MNVCFDGVGQVCATFLGKNLTEGHVVKLTGNGTVGECASGDGFCGAVICAKDDACSVQVAGFVSVPYSGAAPAVGWTALAADGDGGVKTAASSDAGGRAFPVVGVDSANKTVTILL